MLLVCDDGDGLVQLSQIRNAGERMGALPFLGWTIPDAPIYGGEIPDEANKLSPKEAVKVFVISLALVHLGLFAFFRNQNWHLVKRWRGDWKIELIEKHNPTWRDFSMIWC